MDSNQIAETVMGMNVVYKATMELYESYFQTLEAAIKATPDSEVEKLKSLNTLFREAEEALQADLAVFEKVVSTDAEGLMNIQDELKIQSIYNKLKS